MEFFSNPLHLTLLIIVLVLVFGASKIGDVGGALGKSIREFRKEAGKDEVPANRSQVQTPPATGYIPPAPPTYNQQTPSSYQPAQPLNQVPPVVGPGDYRPGGSAPVPPPTATVPPENPGR